MDHPHSGIARKDAVKEDSMLEGWRVHYFTSPLKGQSTRHHILSTKRFLISEGASQGMGMLLDQKKTAAGISAEIVLKGKTRCRESVLE